MIAPESSATSGLSHYVGQSARVRRGRRASAARAPARGLDRDHPAACIWISSPLPAPLDEVARAVQAQLLARHVPTEHLSATPSGDGDRLSVPSSNPQVVDYLAEAAFAWVRREVTAVVACPLLDWDAIRAVREQMGRLVRVCVYPAVEEVGPPPIPTIYWFVEGPHIREAAVLPRATASADRADIIVGGAARTPTQLAGEIVDVLFRSRWLIAPSTPEADDLGPEVEILGPVSP